MGGFLPCLNRDKLGLEECYVWFQVPLTYWLVTFQHETFSRVHKALELDKEVKLVHEVVKYSNSAVDVQACFAKVCANFFLVINSVIEKCHSLFHKYHVHGDV